MLLIKSLEAWIGPIPKGYEVNHIDGNKKNNEVSNFEIVIKSENISMLTYEEAKLRINAIKSQHNTTGTGRRRSFVWLYQKIGY